MKLLFDIKKISAILDNKYVEKQLGLQNRLCEAAIKNLTDNLSQCLTESNFPTYEGRTRASYLLKNFFDQKTFDKEVFSYVYKNIGVECRAKILLFMLHDSVSLYKDIRLRFKFKELKKLTLEIKDIINDDVFEDMSYITKYCFENIDTLLGLDRESFDAIIIHSFLSGSFTDLDINNYLQLLKKGNYPCKSTRIIILSELSILNLSANKEMIQKHWSAVNNSSDEIKYSLLYMILRSENKEYRNYLFDKILTGKDDHYKILFIEALDDISFQSKTDEDLIQVAQLFSSLKEKPKRFGKTQLYKVVFLALDKYPSLLLYALSSVGCSDVKRSLEKWIKKNSKSEIK